MNTFRHVLLCISVIPNLLIGLLTDEQKQSYQQNGYLVISDFFSNEACDTLRHRAAELVNDFDPSSTSSVFASSDKQIIDSYFLGSASNISFFFEKDVWSADGSLRLPKEYCINKIGHAQHDLDPIFSAFSRDPKLEELTHDLGINNPLLIQSMYIFKQPYIGGEVSCHQDSTFLLAEPDTIIGYWIALEDATIENGCLWAIPGRHKQGLKSMFISDGISHHEFVTLDPTPWDEENKVPLEVKKGSLIVLHGYVPHMSFANTSPKSRHAYTLHVMDASSHYSELNWLKRPQNFPFRGF